MFIYRARTQLTDRTQVGITIIQNWERTCFLKAEEKLLNRLIFRETRAVIEDRDIDVSPILGS